MSSEFIERSKHAPISAEVEKHIMSDNGHRATPGDSSGKPYAKFASSNWNQREVPGEWPDQGGGYGYTPPSQAGHTAPEWKSDTKPAPIDCSYVTK